MDWSGLVAIFAGVVIVVYMLIRRSHHDDDRREMIIAYAAQRGYTAHVSRRTGWKAALWPSSGDYAEARSIQSQLREIFPFDTGNERKAMNIVETRVGANTFYSIDFRHTVTEGNRQVQRLWGVTVLKVGTRFPYLLVRPKTSSDMIRRAFGLNDIQFESESFNRAYVVTCDKDKFAYDIVNPMLIDLMQGMPERYLQLSGNFIVLSKRGLYSCLEIDQAIRTMEQIWNSIPQYVKEDLSFDPIRSSRLN